MKTTSKILSLLLAIVLVVGLAACNGGGSSSSTASSAASSTSSEAQSTESAEGGDETGSEVPATGDIDTSQEVEIVMLVLGNKPTNGRMEAAVAEENILLKEKVNATIKLQYIEWADWQTQYQLALASGDSSIDLIITATDWLFAWQLSKKGAFLPLSEELLSTYAPTTWSEVTPDHWEACTLDGNIWFIPEDQFSQWTNHGIYWRKDWADEGGVTQVTNFTELGQYFAAVKENHSEAYPWDASAPNNLGGLSGGYILDNTSQQVIMGAETGNFATFYYDTSDPYTVVSPMFDDVYVEMATLMKEWGDAGYWREDVLNYQAETRDMMYAGTSGADQHHTQTYIGGNGTRTMMDEKQPGSELQYFWWGMENGNYLRDLITHGAIAVSASSKNPERALLVYDLMRNDETIYQFHNFGIEGVDYINNGNGTMGRPEGWDGTVDALDTNFWGGRMDKYQLDDEKEYAGKDELYATLAAGCKDYALGKFVFDPTPVQAEMAALSDVCATHIPSIAYGKAGDPAAAVEAFRDALNNAGYEKVKAELQSQLDALKASEG